MAPRAIMLCADDYAIAPGVSRGVREAIEAGRLTATSAMTNRPEWPDAAREFASLRARADLGVHLNLTCGAPLGAMPGFAPTGTFPGLGLVVAGALLGLLPQAEIRAEIVRQLDAFEQAAGGPPDFVDGHQHVHAFRGVRRWLVEEMARRGWAGRVWIRDCGDGLSRILARRVEAVKAAEVAGLALGLAAVARGAGFETNAGFSGFSAFDPRRPYAADFASYLKRPGPRHLVMCHPGHADRALAGLGEIDRTREMELSFLLSPDFEKALEAADARLARWTARAAD
jgi:predicted glycoside hydrolase/deacetylase ChbG (UPF0249 family)